MFFFYITGSTVLEGEDVLGINAAGDVICPQRIFECNFINDFVTSEFSLEQLVTVHVLVTVIQKTTSTLKKQEAVIVDGISSIKLVLWESHVDGLEKGETYILRNLWLKESRGEKYVNTPKTWEYSYKLAPPLEQLAESEHVELEKIKETIGTVIGINKVAKSLSCVTCEGKVGWAVLNMHCVENEAENFSLSA